MNFAFESPKDTTSARSGEVHDALETLRDTTLPQLEAVRDGSIMKNALQRALFGADARYRIEDCVLAYIRYKPGRNCLIHYRTVIRDSSTHQNHVQRLAARVLPPALSRDAFLKAQRDGLLSSPLSAPVHHLPDLGMVVWLFPNDAKLEGLTALVDERRLGDFVLPRLSAEAAGPDWIPSSWRTEVVSYVPERRCTLRADVLLKHRITGESRAQTFYGKAYPNHAGRTTQRNMKKLRDAHAGRAAPFGVAQPLLYEEEAKILWQSGICGESLSTLEAGSDELLCLLEEAARGIGALHTLNLDCDQSAAQESPVKLLEHTGDALSRRIRRCSGLVGRLMAAAGSLRTSPRATVHRDLHLDNIFATDEGIALIDLDGLAGGDPVQDICCFLAHLCSWSLRKGLDGERVVPMVRAVVRSYLDSVPWEIRQEEIGWHLAAALIYQQASRCIVKPTGWRLAILDDLVRLAERINRGGIR